MADKEVDIDDPVEEKPKAEPKPEPKAAPKAEPPKADGNKVQMKNVTLAGQTLTIGEEVVTVNDFGIFEVCEKSAERLLTLKGFEKI